MGRNHCFLIEMIFFPSKGCLLPIRISLIPLLYSSLLLLTITKRMHWRKLALCRFGQCCKSGEEGGRVTCLPSLLPSPPFPPPLFLPISVHFLLLPSASFYPSVSQMMDHTHPRTPRGRDQQVASEEFPDQISVPATNNLNLGFGSDQSGPSPH